MRRLFVILALVFAQPLYAMGPGETAFRLGVSSMGLMAEAEHRLTPAFALRGFYAGGLSADQDEEIDGIDYDGEASLGGIGLLGAYYPGNGGFHISAGLFMSTGEFEATASDTALEVGGSTYDASVKATAEFSNQIAPMFSLGYDQSLGSNWSVGAEIGAIAIGGIDVSLEETTLGGNVIPTADLNAEVDALSDDLSDLTVYPFLSLKATYRF